MNNLPLAFGTDCTAHEDKQLANLICGCFSTGCFSTGSLGDFATAAFESLDFPTAELKSRLLVAFSGDLGVNFIPRLAYCRWNVFASSSSSLKDSTNRYSGCEEDLTREDT